MTHPATDRLTGLPNQRAVQDSLKRMVAQASRSITPLAAVMLDLDPKMTPGMVGEVADQTLFVPRTDWMLQAMLAGHLAAGRIRLLLHHEPVAADTERSRRRTGGKLDLDLRAELDDAGRRQAQEVGRGRGVAVHAGEQFLAPVGHAAVERRDDDVARQEVRGLHVLDHAAVLAQARDDAVDSLHESVFRILLTHMMGDPRTISASLEFINVSRQEGSDEILQIDFATAFPIAGRPVVLLKDVVNTGVIETYLLNQLSAAGADVTYRELDDLSHCYPREMNAPILNWLAGRR